MLGFEPTGSIATGSAELTANTAPVPTPSQREGMIAIRKYLLLIFGTDFVIVQGQANRVPEPKADNYIVLTAMRRPRLSTNVDSDIDCRFSGSISGTVMTVTEIDYGTLSVGSPIFGVGVLDGTKVTAFGNSDGSVGTYTISPSQNVSQRTLAAGVHAAQQNTTLVVQADVHGTSGGDNAQTLTTAVRDPYAVEWFLANHPEVTPLYAEEPRQVPFLNAEQQYEDRWAIEIMLQVKPTIRLPQQFADQVRVTPIAVEAIYPARS